MATWPFIDGSDDQFGPDYWDAVVIDDVTLPGLVEIDGGAKRDLDIKKAKKTDGATYEDNGYAPAAISITLRIGNAIDWSIFQDLLPRIHPRRAGATRAPLGIIHPSLAVLGITQVYVTEIGLPKPSGAVIQVSIKAIEDVPVPKPAKQGGSAAKKAQYLDEWYRQNAAAATGAAAINAARVRGAS